jgi:hypothetical protein
MSKHLTAALYETVILKSFKVPGLLLTCYGTTDIRCVFYSPICLVTSACECQMKGEILWPLDAGVYLRCLGSLASCKVCEQFRQLYLCFGWMTRRIAHAILFAYFATLYQLLMRFREYQAIGRYTINRNLGWSDCGFFEGSLLSRHAPAPEVGIVSRGGHVGLFQSDRELEIVVWKLC